MTYSSSKCNFKYSFMVESETGKIINDIHKIICESIQLYKENDGRNPGPDKGITSTKCQFNELGYIR